MGKVTDCLKGCWSQPNVDEQNVEGPDGTDEVPPHPAMDFDDDDDDDDNKPSPVFGMLDIYSHVIAEANKAWEDDVNSAVLRDGDNRSIPSLLPGPVADGNMEDNLPDIIASVGEQLLGYSSSIVDVHRFFLRLNPKRFLPQADGSAVPLYDGTMKTVQEGESSTRARRQRLSDPLQSDISLDVFLNEPEKGLYKRALQCIYYPVLSSPSSEPSVTPPFRQGSSCSSSGSEGSVLSPTDKVSIEPEMLMTCLREGFGITRRIHDRYFNEVKQSIPNRDPGKLLLHELQERFYQVETNQHNYYRIGSFLSTDGYSKWRIRQLDEIKRLIRRFWKRDIAGCLGMKVSDVNAHQEYRILQEKLFKYEMQMKEDANTDNSEMEVLSIFPVSTAAKKILKEFRLRYGVCTLFQRISSLLCMAKNFKYHGWYIKCCTQAIFEIKRLLKTHYGIIVKDEHDMLIKALNLFQESIEHTLKNTKLLCPKKMPFDTVSWMFEMLKAIIKIKTDLGIWDESEPSEEELIRRLIKKAIAVGYNQIKGRILINMEIETPQMVRCLLGRLRSELGFYKEFERRCPDIAQYMNIENVAAVELYGMLMNDVRAVCIQKMEPGVEDSSINLEMLRLAYLLANLDKDWNEYIAPSFQKWRIYFMKEVKITMDHTTFSILSLIRTLISKEDPGRTLEFKQNKSPNGNSPARATPGIQSIRSCTTQLSVSSLVPSETSAFTRVNRRAGSGSIATDAGFLEKSNCVSRGYAEATVPFGIGEEESGKEVASSAVQNDRGTEVAGTSQTPRAGTMAVKVLVTGKSAYGANSRLVHGAEGSTIDKDGLSSAYETLPSSRINDSIEFTNGSRGAFQSLAHDSKAEAASQIKCGDRDYPSGHGTESVTIPRTAVSEDSTEETRNVSPTEDEMIDAFVNDILDRAIDSIRQEGGFSPNTVEESGVQGRIYESDSARNIASSIKNSSCAIPFKDEPHTSSKSDFNVIEAAEGHRKCEQIASSYPSPTSKSIRKIPVGEYVRSVRSESSLIPRPLKTAVPQQPRRDSKEDKFSSQLSHNLAPEEENSPSDRFTSSSVDTLADSISDLPNRGRILVSGSLIDILVTIERTSAFFKELCSLVIPTTYHSKFSDDFQKLRNEHETFSAHLFQGLAVSIKNTLITYADGILALDICGIHDLPEIVNVELIKGLREKQKTGLISGCRHNLSRRMSTRAFKEGVASEYCPQVLKILRFCIGECEAISPQICIRINNIRSLIEVLDSIEKRAKRVCGITSSWGDEPAVNSHIMNTALQLGRSEFRNCKESLEVIWKSQIDILSHRITVMLGKIIDVLLSLTLKWADKAPYKVQMKPVSIFLKHQMEILKENLYPVSLSAVVCNIWERIIKMLHSYADKLRLNKSNPEYHAKRYIQLMSNCLNQLVVDDDTNNRLTALCQQILLRFRLYSYPRESLKLTYEISANLEVEDQSQFGAVTFKDLLYDMRSTGILKRAFTGAEFVQALVNNRFWMDLLGRRGALSDLQHAINIGEELLRMEMITCVESPRSVEAGVRYFTPSASQGNDVHAVVHVGSHEFLLSPRAENDGERVVEPLDHSFENLESHVYQVKTEACNVSDVSLQVCRVLRPADVRFSKVIQRDVLGILEYRTFWKKEKDCIDILRSLSPSRFRPKASSCPGDMY